jgi:hypothetical protein
MPKKEKSEILLRTATILLGALVLVVVCGGLYMEYQNLQRVDGDALEVQVRDALPKGASQDDVTRYLGKHGMDFSTDARTQEVDTIVKDVRGGDFIVRHDIHFIFHFDDDGKLKYIDTVHHVAGP